MPVFSLSDTPGRARETGTLPLLKPGESRMYGIESGLNESVDKNPC